MPYFLIMQRFFTLLVYLFVFISCKSNYYVRQTHEYPKAFDTKNKKIGYQKKKLYQIGDVFADNRFAGARLNGFKQINDTLYEVYIKPENMPINPSPWYAFKIWAKRDKDIYIKLKYQKAKHRYTPKISKDRRHWQKIEALYYGVDSLSLNFPVHLSKQVQWIAGQEIINSNDVKKWIDSLAVNPFIKEHISIGKSVLGRSIPYFRIGEGSSKNKKVIVLLSRQHPPEVTGFKALQFFIDELLNKNDLTKKFYQSYDIWVFPILNPDGVDMGHWRHNANGIDLNRDWAYFRQPEIDAVTNFIVNKAKEGKNKVVLGIDFHSTFKDVYYVFDDSFHTALPDFNKYWTTSIDRLVYPHKTRKSPYVATQPISKNWFYFQFQAEAMTYEIGDATPVNIIRKKSKASAISMMNLLLNTYE